MHTTETARSVRRILVTLTALVAAATSCRAQQAAAGEKITRLDSYTVTATRIPGPINEVSSTVTVLPLIELERLQIPDLATALRQVPGISVARTGAAGSASSVHIRGAQSHHTLFVVDGVRMNDKGSSYNHFIGGAELGGIERIEILRGPQSTLYGSSAAGGVIFIDTARGGENFSGTLGAEYGSFDTWKLSATAGGTLSQLSVAGTLSHEQTDNDRPDNSFKQTSASLRLEWTPVKKITLGATLRLQDGSYDEVGGITAPSTGTIDFTNILVTTYAEYRLNKTFRSRLTLAWNANNYDWTDTSGSPWASNSQTDNDRLVLDWLNTWKITQTLTAMGGINTERLKQDKNPGKETDDLKAAYTGLSLKLPGDIHLDASVRYDDYKSTGGKTTWRLGAAWTLASTKTKFRATGGTAFSTPSLDDRYGSMWQPANPNIKPEETSGWDIGFDQPLLGNRATLSATYFNNRFKNLFGYDPVTFMTTNTERARTQGVEVGLSVKINSKVFAQAAYTYLDAEDRVNNTQLIRRPKHTINAQVAVTPAEKWTIGLGIHSAFNRVDAPQSAPSKLDDYTTLRLFASYEFPRGITAKLRIENLLDKDYEEVAGYPALPLGIHGSLQWKF